MGYELAICELYNKKIHGFDKNSDKNIDSHFLCHYIDSSDDNNIEEIVQVFQRDGGNFREHEFIRNYRIITNKLNYNPQIAEIFYLSGDECVAVLKTFWLKIVQRCWKRVYLSRMKSIKERTLLKSLYFKEINGKWPNTMPSITGMFYNLR